MTQTIKAVTLNHKLARSLDGHYEELVREFQQPLYAFAYRMCGGREDAEEIVQDVFVRAYRAMATYERQRIETLALRSWLFRICVNLSRNRHRRHQPDKVEFVEELHSRPTDGDQGDPTGDRIQQQEDAKELQHLVVNLPTKCRAAILLRFVNELSYPEIAEVLDQPEGTVKSNVHRGLGMLRNQLSSAQKEIV